MSALAVITGAGSGLGKSLHGALATREFPCVTITLSALTGDPARHISADLAERHDWPSKLAPILSQLAFERLWFFDNAAVLPQGEVLAPDFDVRLEEAMQVNVWSPLAIARALAGFARQRSALLDVVHISSGAAHRAIPNWGAYCMSKASAAMAWHQLEAEEPCVTAHLVQPGVIDTAMQRRLREAGDPVAADPSLLRSPEEVAAMILTQCGVFA